VTKAHGVSVTPNGSGMVDDGTQHGPVFPLGVHNEIHNIQKPGEALSSQVFQVVC